MGKNKNHSLKMRNENYKVGWLVPQKLAALTHFHSDISSEDIEGVFKDTERMISNVNQLFSIVIDNRLAPMNRVYSLEELQNSSSILKHPLLEYLIIIIPKHLTLNAEQKKVEISNGVKLINTESVKNAIDLIKENKGYAIKEEIISDFFPNLECL